MKHASTELKNDAGEVYATVYYDALMEATVDVWVGEFGSQENFIRGLEAVLENIRVNRSRKWLADLSGIRGNFSFVREYIPANVLPLARKYGLRYEALVLPYDIFGLLSVQMTIEEMGGLEIQLFDRVDDAKNWLRSR